MLTITVQNSPDYWDEKNEVFVDAKTTKLQLEHSLVSISKWEQKWHKPFLSKKEKTYDEIIDYIKDMTLTQNVKPEVYNCLSTENIKEIDEYINDPMTATTFSNANQQKGNRETVTSELIYYWMIQLNIPFECRKWHLNTLLTLIEVCNVKNSPPKKMSKKDLYRHHAAVNAARRPKKH